MNVGLLRRNPQDLSEQELNALKAAAKGAELNLIRLDPVDAEDHDTMCRESDIEMVLLPRERPIPSIAMERGVKHLTFNREGELHKLRGMQVDLVPIDQESG